MLFEWQLTGYSWEELKELYDIKSDQQIDPEELAFVQKALNLATLSPAAIARLNTDDQNVQVYGRSHTAGILFNEKGIVKIWRDNIGEKRYCKQKIQYGA